MEKYIAVDAGKGSTKIAYYAQGCTSAKAVLFRTKVSAGDFRDDALEQHTILMEYEGVTYKIGNGATREATQETTKQDDIHRLCAIASIAMCCSSKEKEVVHAAIGMPVNEWENVAKRVAFKDYIFPKGEVHVKLKISSDSPVVEKVFTIASTHVYPETQGALFIDEETKLGKVGVIDLGHKNNNCTIWEEGELQHKYSITGNLGGGRLSANIARALTKEFTYCDEDTVIRLLAGPKDERFLHSNRHDESVENRSREIINEELLKHVKDIRRACDLAEWPVDYMSLYFIGGTSTILSDQVIDVFGNGIYIPHRPEFANALGFLRVMCGKLLQIKIGMPEYIKNILDDTKEENGAA